MNYGIFLQDKVFLYFSFSGYISAVLELPCITWSKILSHVFKSLVQDKLW